jgi:hypothetical protein
MTILPLLILIWGGTENPPTAAIVEWVDGRTSTGEILAIDPRSVVLQSGHDKITIDRQQILAIDLPGPIVDEPTETALLLRGDGIIRVRQIQADDRVCTLERTDGQNLQVPMGQVLAIVFEMCDRAELTARYRQWGVPSERDRLVAVRGNERAVLSGLVGPITPETVTFTLDQQTLDVKRERVREIGFALTTADAKANVLLTDREGNTWPADDIEKSAESFVSLSENLGRLEWPAENLRRIDFSGRRVRHLSTLEPVLVEQTPYFDQVWPWKIDRSLEEEPLRLRAGDGSLRLYSRGLALHSRTALTYTLEPDQSRLVVDVGIDPDVAPAGSAKVVILVGAKIIWEQEITGRDSIRSLDLPLPKPQPGTNGERRLTLLVDFGAQGDMGDQVIFGQPRLIQ